MYLDEYYTRSTSGDSWAVDLKPEEADGGIPDFGTKKLLGRGRAESGKIFTLPFLQTDRTLYFRMRFSSCSIWSQPYNIDRRLYGLQVRQKYLLFGNAFNFYKQARYDKHKAELVAWDHASQQDLPQIFLKKEWGEVNTSRRVEFFASFVIVNKTGLLCRYSSNEKLRNFSEADTSDEGHRASVLTLEIPLMLNCLHNSLRVLPYAMESEIDSLMFYVFWPELETKRTGFCKTVRGLNRPLKIYSDNDEQMVSTWPASFKGEAILLQTESEDAIVKASELSYLSFKVSIDSFINICFDSRIAKVPPWLYHLGFRSIGERVKSHSCNFQIYRKLYRAYTWVRLGGNRMESTVFSRSNFDASMYFVVVTPTSEDSRHSEACIAEPPSVQPFSVPTYLHQVPNFRIGDAVYADEDTVTVVDLPSLLLRHGVLLLQTFQRDRYHEVTYSFELPQRTRVFICIDIRSSPNVGLILMDSGYIDSNLRLETSRGIFVLFGKDMESKSLVMVNTAGLTARHLHHLFFVLLPLERMSCNTQAPFRLQHASKLDTTVSRLRSFWNKNQGELFLIPPDFDNCGRYWSLPFNLTASNKGEVFASGCALSVRVQSLVGVFHRTRTITLLPRFVLINKLSFGVNIMPFCAASAQQVNPIAIESSVLCLKAGVPCVIYHFPAHNESSPKAAPKNSWEASPYVLLGSGLFSESSIASDACPIRLNMVGEQFTWLNDTLTNSDSKRVVVAAAIKSQGTVFSIILSETGAYSPLRLENRSHALLLYRQFVKISNLRPQLAWLELPPMSWRAFIWSLPFENEKLVEISIAGIQSSAATMSFDGTGFGGTILSWSRKDIKGTTSICEGKLGSEVFVDITTRVMRFFEVGLNKDATLIRQFITEKSQLQGLHITKKDERSTRPPSRHLSLKSLQANIFLGGIYIRMTDGIDIFGLSVERLGCQLTAENRRVELQVHHLQLDDLSVKAKFPVVFSPSFSGRNSHLQKGNKRSIPFISVSCGWIPNEGILVHFSDLDVLVGEFGLRLSMDFLFRMVSTIGRASTNVFTGRMTTGSNLFADPQDQHPDLAAAQAVLEMKISDRILKEFSLLTHLNFCVQRFHYSSLVIHLEVFVGSKALLMDFNKMDKSLTRGFAILGGPMVSILSSVVGSIAHISPVFVFESFQLFNFVGNLEKFLHVVYTVLNQQAFAQAYKVFGSLELIGNPLSFIDNISTGVNDLYSRTLEEVERSALTRGEGVRQLAFSVIIGTFGTASRVTGSLADLSRVVSGKEGQTDYIESSPENIVEGLQQGGGALLRSVRKGLTGLVEEPRKGFVREGLFGAVKGVGKGMIRLISLPITGSLEAMSLMAESIENGAQDKPVGRVFYEPKAPD